MTTLRRPSSLLAPLAGILLFLLTLAGSRAEVFSPLVCYPDNATPREILGAREVRRYLYLRTGVLAPVEPVSSAPGRLGGAILVGGRDQPVVRACLATPELRGSLDNLEGDQYLLKTVSHGLGRVVVLTGASDTAALYAAYRFAEHLGVRFYLHGDVLPDAKMPWHVPSLDERGLPFFALRGIQPFHDFPEGPDWWNRDDYAAVLGQLPKLRMNFFGLHTYPENAPNAEPTVWIGQAGDFQANGHVTFSYPASYQNTLRGNWGYQPRKTGEYLFGADSLFEHDAFASTPMLGFCPQPETPADGNTVFNRTADLLRYSFTLARDLGIKTCAGTETPLTIPKRVAERLRAAGKDPQDMRVRRELYAGMFQRIAAAYPLDYYWFWTPEGWTWEGTKEEQIRLTTNDLSAAIRAARDVNAPFRLATCGWVLGPQQDRALFDKMLPKEMAISCINREVGKTPVEPGFAEVRGRGKWAIPWLEDDPALTSPQLWAGRMRRDAADARRYGCDGLLGIHWRTRVLGPAVAALAQAAWRQDPWNTDPLRPVGVPLVPPGPRTAGPVGGSVAAFPGHAIADTELDEVYQTVRYNLSAYHLPMPNGSYTVTLQFCEPHYEAAGKRAFSVTVQGQKVIDNLDIFRSVGKDRALDFTFEEVVVNDGWLDLGFLPVIEFPSIAGIVVKGANLTRKINCGGPAALGYEADAPPTAAPPEIFPPVADFYADWAGVEFGPAAGARAAKIFAALDGRLPRPSDWVDGPGGTKPDARPWSDVAPQYAFVDELAALRPLARGAGEQARLDYWISTFEYMRAMARVNCTWAVFNQAMQQAKAAPDAGARRQAARNAVLPVRRQLVAEVAEVYRHLLATLSNPGELGTLANWEQHILPGVLHKPGEELAGLLGERLPEDAMPARAYRGPTRLVVPTQRTSVYPGEPLQIRALVLAERPPRRAVVAWRPLGTGSFQTRSMLHAGRGVFLLELPAGATASDLEYYVEVLGDEDTPVRFPASAPALNQSVITLGARR
jgi:hypothetical protein